MKVNFRKIFVISIVFLIVLAMMLPVFAVVTSADITGKYSGSSGDALQGSKSVKNTIAVYDENDIESLKKEYDKDKMVSGIIKIGGVGLGIVFMLGSAYLTKDIIVANVNNQNVNLLDGMKYVFMAGIVFYGAQDVNKLVKILKVNVPISEKTEQETISIKKDNLLDRGE